MHMRAFPFALMCGAFCMLIQTAFSQEPECFRYTPAPCSLALPICGDNQCWFIVTGYQNPLYPHLVPYLWMPITQYRCPVDTQGSFDISSVRMVSACWATSGGYGYPTKGATEKVHPCHKTRLCALSCTTLTVRDPDNDKPYVLKEGMSWQGALPVVEAFKSYCDEGVNSGTPFVVNYYECTGSERACP